MKAALSGTGHGSGIEGGITSGDNDDSGMDGAARNDGEEATVAVAPVSAGGDKALSRFLRAY